jgi:hypothetical protein
LGGQSGSIVVFCQNFISFVARHATNAAIVIKYLRRKKVDENIRLPLLWPKTKSTNFWYIKPHDQSPGAGLNIDIANAPFSPKVLGLVIKRQYGSGGNISFYLLTITGDG